MKVVKNKIRLFVEESDLFQGFLMTHSISGGTGSSASNFMKYLSDNYDKKKTRMAMTVLPNPGRKNNFQSITVEP